MQNTVRATTICFLTFLSIFSIDIMPQEQSEADTSKKSYTHGIQFYIINQVIAAYKYNFTDASSLRFTFNVTGLVDNEDRENVNNSYNDTTRNRSENKYIDNSFEVKLHYLHNLEINRILNFFLGAGPLFNFRFVQTNYYDEDHPMHDSWSRNQSWNLGVSALAGVECVVYKYITLFTEYEAAVLWGKQSVDIYFNSGSDHTEHDNYKFELRGLRVGVGIYF